MVKLPSVTITLSSTQLSDLFFNFVYNERQEEYASWGLAAEFCERMNIDPDDHAGLIYDALMDDYRARS